MMGVMVNYLAVLAAAVASIALGMVWYGPLFGKVWMRLSGFTPKSMKQMRLTAGQAMVLGTLVTLVMAYVVAVLLNLLSVVSFAGAAKLAVLLWLGLSLPLVLGGFLWENKPFALVALNAAYRLVELLVIAAVIVAMG